MPRRRADYAPVLAAARGIETRLGAAITRGMVRARNRVGLTRLADALSRRDVNAAMRVIDGADIADALAPAGAILRDAVTKGGKLGGEAVNRTIKGARRWRKS